MAMGACGLRGRYHVRQLIKRYGMDVKLFEWSDEITTDCPRKQARSLNDQCGVLSPNLAKVVYCSQWVNSMCRLRPRRQMPIRHD
jgi:hypothetical protein